MNGSEEIEAVQQADTGTADTGATEATTTTDEVAKMYADLGIKSPAPTGAAKGRPKSTTVRAKDVSDKDDSDTKHERKESAQGSDKPKDAPDTVKHGDKGDDPDPKSSKVGEDSGKVPGGTEETDEGVRKAEPKSKEDSERGREEGSDDGDERAGEEAEEIKREGKSNPKIERRFQKMTADVRERDERIAELQQQLQSVVQEQTQQKVQHEDPKYSVDDFRRVRDDEGNVIDLGEDEAELAYRRWQDGYNQRASEREAEAQHQMSREREEAEMSEQVMQRSVEAYDTLAGLMDEFPQLVGGSGKYDAEFAAQAMPIIQESIIYQPGTEPGNEKGERPVILGMRMHPKRILEAMTTMGNAKRNLPLNGTNDNVDTRSNVRVSHGRSSDATVNAANELMKDLNINKRF